MATSVGLNFRLTAAVDRFEGSMKDVERRLGGIEKASKDTASGMRVLAAIEVGRSVISGLTALFNVFKSGVSVVNNFVSSASETADAIGKLATSTGMAHEPLQAYIQLAEYGGVGASQFGDAVQRMTRGLGEAANGTGTAGRALRGLGIDIAGLLKLSPERQFAVIAESLEQIEDPARKAAYAADIFGRSGVKLIPMFEGFAENAAEVSREMVLLGQVLGESQVKNIEAMNDSFGKVKATAHGILTQVLANFAPALTRANDLITEMIKKFTYDGREGGTAIAMMITDALFNGAAVLLNWVETASNVFLSIASGLMKVAEMFLTFVAGLAEWADTFYKIFAPLTRAITGKIEVDPETIAALRRLADSAGGASEALWNTEADFTSARNFLQEMRDAARDNAATMDDMNPLVDALGDAAETTAVAVEETGKQFGPVAAAAEESSKKLGGLSMEFGEYTGVIDRAKREMEDYASRFEPARDALSDLYGESGLLSSELDTLAQIVAENGGLSGEFGRALQGVIDSTQSLDRVQDELSRSMMKPYEDFASKRAEMLRRMGFNPFFVEQQKQKWLALQKQGVDRQIEVWRNAYDKFLERTGEGTGTAIKDAITETLDLEETLPELKTQTSTLGDILTAVKEQILQPVLIPG